LARDRLVERHTGNRVTYDTAQQRHHQRPVAARVLLRPPQVAPVRVHLRRTGEEHGEVAVGQVGVVRQAPRDGDVPLRELLADVAGTRMQHQPDPAGL